MSIRVLLVDDHNMMRQGIEALLKTEADIEIVGQTPSGLEALNMMRRLKPDVLVLDIVLPDLNGMEIARQIIEDNRAARIVILSMNTDIAYPAEALRKGAKAYVTKESGIEHLIQAIRLAAQNLTYFSPPFTQEKVAEHRQKMRTGELNPYDTLTRKERIVFGLLVNGQTSRKIAYQMKIGVRTIHTHRSSILRKFRVTSTAELMRYWREDGDPLWQDPTKNQ